jgi:hypothetical protein
MRVGIPDYENVQFESFVSRLTILPKKVLAELNEINSKIQSR